MVKNNSSQAGVALLMALGILALLSILGVAFSTNMRLMERTTRDFVYDMQARYLAEGGIEYAIGALKEDARNRFVFDGIDQNSDELVVPEIEYPNDIKGTTTVNIIDTARQININNADSLLLACLPDIGTKRAEAIIKLRNSGIKFLTKKSICLANEVGKDIYAKIKDYITTDTYIDPNVLDKDGKVVQVGRSAININTIIKNPDVIQKILSKCDGVSTGIANRIIEAIRNNVPINSWEEFNNIIDSISGISDSNKKKIKDIFNPNRSKPVMTGSGKGLTTEFCFHSGGRYDLTAICELKKQGKVLASKRINSIVKIFDLWNQTTKEQFRGDEDTNADGDINDDGEDLNRNGIWDIPTYQMVTWMDSCPVLATEYWSNSNSNITINDSLKIGYWDDFNNVGYYKANWHDEKTLASELSYVANGVLNMPTFGEVILGKDTDRWDFGDSSVTIIQHDNIDLNTKREVDPNWWCATGYFMFRYRTADEYVFQGIDIYKDGGVYDDEVEAQINGAKSYIDSSYVQTKVYRILQKGSNFVYLWIDKNLDGSFDFSHNLSCSGRSASTGKLKLFMQGTWGVTNNSCTWDSLRIIPSTGKYISVPTNKTIPLLDLDDAVQWGTLWATVTLPEENAGVVRFKASNNLDDLSDPDGSVELIGNNADGISLRDIPNSTVIQYGAYFECGDTENYLKTPILEDVWVTYLPKTKILYWREGAED